MAETHHKEEIDDYEKRLDELRRRFDLYFQGSPEQRIPPTTMHAQLAGEVRRIRESMSTWSTIEKFRVNQIHQRLVSYDRMWARTLKQIEDGVYKRDKFKLAQKKKKQVEQPTETTQTNGSKKPAPVGLDPLDSIDVDMQSFDDVDDLPLVSKPPQPAQTSREAPAVRAAPRPAAAAPARPGDFGGMTEQRMKQLYDVYMQAKRRTGESSSLSFDALKSQIAKQVPQIKQKHACAAVDFKVVLKDGKAMLKAVPK